MIERVTTIRIKFEMRTWHVTYARLNNQFDKSVNDIGEIGNAIGGWLADSTAGRLTDDAQRTIAARRKF